VQNGRVLHPYVGVSYAPLTPAIAAQLGTEARDGIIILEVVPGSGAEAAGLQAEDVVTAIDDTALVGESDFAEIINQHQPGDTVTFDVVRGGQTQSVQVTLGERPQE
jgi:S1-C subfamily serine protease